MYCGYVTALKNVRLHPNADRLKLAECFGNTVIVDLDAAEGEIGVYFPVDGKLGVEFAIENNLLKKTNDLGISIGGYLDPEKRNIRALRLRGEKSDGLFCPLSSFKEFCNLDDLNVGDQITTLNGITICEKYIPRGNFHNQRSDKSRATKKPKVNLAPLFAEHKDTEQLRYNLSAFHQGDVIEVTLKLHGTSGRSGYLPILQPETKKTFLDRILRRPVTPTYKWGYIHGTRHIVLGDSKDMNGGFYGSNNFRIEHGQKFEGKLQKGETVYYEIVGYLPDGSPIMPSGSNKKNGIDKNFIKLYGAETVFSYGCAVGQSEIYVYRMTMINDDGFVVEYSPDQVRARCDQMGIKYVPLLKRFVLSNGDGTLSQSLAGKYIQEIAEAYNDGPDPIGITHVREGVVVRIVSAPTLRVYKDKNFSFKVLEGIIKENAVEADMEEIQDA